MLCWDCKSRSPQEHVRFRNIRSDPSSIILCFSVPTLLPPCPDRTPTQCDGLYGRLFGGLLENLGESRFDGLFGKEPEGEFNRGSEAANVWIMTSGRVVNSIQIKWSVNLNDIYKHFTYIPVLWVINPSMKICTRGWSVNNTYSSSIRSVSNSIDFIPVVTNSYVNRFNHPWSPIFSVLLVTHDSHPLQSSDWHYQAVKVLQPSVKVWYLLISVA